MSCYCVQVTYDKWNRPVQSFIHRSEPDENPTSWVTWEGEERTECDAYRTEKEAFKAMRKTMKRHKQHRLLKLADLFVRCVKECLRDGL